MKRRISKNKEYWFDLQAAERAVDMFAKLDIELDEVQSQIISKIFGWKYRDDKARLALLEILLADDKQVKLLTGPEVKSKPVKYRPDYESR